MALTCTVVITTKDRWSELPAALASVARQSCRPHCIVVDDGSKNPIPDEIVSAFPEFEYRRNPIALGIIRARNAIASEIETDVVASIDDDAVYNDNNVIEDALALMERTDIAAVSIPHVNIIDKSRHVFDQSQTDGVVPIFIGCAYLVKRKIFIEIGGFRDVFIRQGEEDDFCLRLASLDLLIARLDRFGVTHYPSPVRNDEIIRFFRVRNRLLMAFFNFKIEILLLFVAREFILLIKDIILRKALKPEIIGYVRGVVDGCNNFTKRKSISNSVVLRYTNWKRRTTIYYVNDSACK